MFSVLATLLATTTIAYGINWNGNWATSCDFIGNDLTNSLSTGKDCGGRCASTPGCTHYTWTNYNGGTCWMKKDSVSKNNAVPKNDQGAVCGVIVGSVDRTFTGAIDGKITGSIGGNITGALGAVIVDSVVGVVAGNVSGVISSKINWNGKNWAVSCDFVGNDLKNALTRAKDCGGCCASTSGCTHYTWTNYNGGTCWMKKNTVSKSNAVPKYDQGAVCGISISSSGGVITGAVGGVSATTINWNGKNWAASCHFVGNDLANVLTTATDCGGRCASTRGCTHYTWTNYNGGTCWMKKNSVSKNNAVPRYAQGAVCGISVGSSGGVSTGAVGGVSTGAVGGVSTGAVGGVSATTINWNEKNWATSCDFIGNDLTNALTKAEDCGGRCASTRGCTHYTWTNYNGGTCWMKKHSVSKNNAVPKYDQGAVCGVTIGSTGDVISGSVGGGVSASGINWNVNSWAALCDLFNNGLTSVLTRAEDCGWRCMSTLGCTHYTWTNYNGGTCWMKRNKINAVTKYDEGSLIFNDYYRRPMPYQVNQIIINLN